MPKYAKQELAQRKTAKRQYMNCARAVAVSLAVSPAAFAQNDEQSSARSTLEEVVVSARRVEESIQSVPVTVTAFNASALRESTIVTPEDLQMNTPGVFLSSSGGRQNVIYQIRGQSKALSGPSSPAVVSYFAEVPEITYGSSVPQYDMASIQVLKGPQGTLFGRNTTGGAVLYTPQAPSHEFEGYVSASAGNYDYTKLQGAVNVPLVQDRLAVRIAGDISHRDGYTENLGVGGDLDQLDTKAVRASILFTPTEAISNTTIFDYYKSDTAGVSGILTHVGTGDTLMSQLGLQAPALEQLALQEARGPFETETSFAPYERNTRKSLINRTEVDLGSVELVNIFGYRHGNLAYAVNVDGMPTLISAGGGIPAGLPVNFIKADLHQETEQYSNELQLRGRAFDDTLSWLVGGFWLKSEPDGPHGNTVAFAHIPNVTPPGAAAYNFITEESRAIFAHVQYDLDALLAGLQFELGVRYTEDEVESCTAIGVVPPGTAGAFQTSDGASLSDCEDGAAHLNNASVNKAESDETTWSVGLNWQATANQFAYIVGRHGYRAGGINGPTLSGRLAQFQQFAPETVTDVEVGLRSDWDINSVSIRSNVSAFVGRYEDVQSVLTGVQTGGVGCVPGTINPPGVSPDGDCNRNNDPAGGTLLVNLGESEVAGVELDLTIAPTDRLTFNFGGTLLDLDTVKFDTPPALAPYIASPEVPFNFTAEKTFIAGVRYALPLDASLGRELVFNADYYWTDDLIKGDTFIPSYEVTNMRLDWYGVVQTEVDVSLFVRNVFDKEYASSNMASGAFLGLETSIFGPPRMYGAEVRYSF